MYVTFVKEMNLKLNFLFLILLLANGNSAILEESPESFGDWEKALNIFSRANSAEFLKLLSFENISQQCADHTQIFHKKITKNPIVGLTDGYWALKSIFQKFSSYYNTDLNVSEF